MIAHATGTPNIVEARLDSAFDFIASAVVNPNHFLHKRPSITMTGIRSISIAGKVKKIIGRPASASRARLIVDVNSTSNRAESVGRAVPRHVIGNCSPQTAYSSPHREPSA